MDEYIIRKVTEYRGVPVLIQQCGSLFIYVVYHKGQFYSATIKSVAPFWRKHNETEVLDATNLTLTAARTTVDELLK